MLNQVVFSSIIRTPQHNKLLLQKLLLILLLIITNNINLINAKGGEKALYRTQPFTTTITHRQDFCDISKDVHEHNVQLKDALNGVELHPVIQYGTSFPYFNYDPETGIDPDDPGLVAHLLDYIAERANFTWRESFGVYTVDDKGSNRTWTEMLKWTTDTYDIAIDKWAQSTERLNMGIAFCDPWFDGSLVLIDKIEPPPDKNTVNYANWLRPFDMTVWYVTVATIIFSCFVYQLLELLSGERDDRSYKKWFMDNLYLSSINFTQNYTYEPTSLAGRIFGVSFAFWTMLIGATYTANLASLLVEQKGGPAKIADIEEGIARGMSMCTFENSFSDFYIKQQYGQAKRVPKATPEDMYAAVQTGECDILIGEKQSWMLFEGIEEYNPNCDLEWVGRTVHTVDSAFATTVDPAINCTSLINQVFNYYLSEMIDTNFFNEQWDTFNNDRATPGFNCNANTQDDESSEQRRNKRRKRQLTTTSQIDNINKNSNNNNNFDRSLKGGGGGGGANPGAAAAGGGGADDNDGEESLTLEQMAGTFLLHLVGSALAIIVGIASYYVKRSGDDNEKFKHVSDGSMGSSRSDLSVQEQLDALRSSQKELTKQMSTVVSMLQRIQETMDHNHSEHEYLSAKADSDHGGVEKVHYFFSRSSEN